MVRPNLVTLHRRPATLATGHPALRGLEDMEHIFDTFFSDAFSHSPLSRVELTGTLATHLDVAETETAYLVTAEIPGLDSEDIDLSLADGVLTLKAEKTREQETPGKTFHRVERHYGSIRRVLRLPADADENAVVATMKNGVLQIEIGKNTKADPVNRKISIKAG